ncbi:MAG: BMP family ABC transporter substrate-binding protein [Lachnospiraceae bacterium]|nr:BMP family ABC transporter substrate-binding protein [Lachnospiraceae bacterium]
MNLSGAKKLVILVGVILAAIVIGMIFIEDEDVDTDVTAKTTNIGLILTGSRDDRNFSQSHYDALLGIKDELNLNIVCRDEVEYGQDCLEAIRELIEKEGCRLIIAASFGFGDSVKEMAGLYPDICFIHPSGTERFINLACCYGRMYQARYLSGIVAGLRTESKEIGYVAAFPISEVIRGINAFTLGVRSVAPEAEVHVAYCDSWNDDGMTREVSEKLLDQWPGIDIMAMHSDSLEPNRIADQKGIYSVGYNKDNAGLFPDSYLTACVWNWEDYYKEQILNCLKGRFYGSVDWIGMEDGIVGLSELTANCGPGTEEAVEKAVKRFENRSFDVFYGPIVDNKGVLRVPMGESMSDDEMLNHFDWYVEGVSVEE